MNERESILACTMTGEYMRTHPTAKPGFMATLVLEFLDYAKINAYDWYESLLDDPDLELDWLMENFTDWLVDLGVYMP